MQSPLCAGWGWKEGEQAGGWNPPPQQQGSQWVWEKRGHIPMGVPDTPKGGDVPKAHSPSAGHISRPHRMRGPPGTPSCCLWLCPDPRQGLAQGTGAECGWGWGGGRPCGGQA